MPLPAKAKDDHMPESLQKLVTYMRDSYQSASVWWEGAQSYQPNKDVVYAFEQMNMNASYPIFQEKN